MGFFAYPYWQVTFMFNHLLEYPVLMNAEFRKPFSRKGLPREIIFWVIMAVRSLSIPMLGEVLTWLNPAFTIKEGDI